MYPYMGAQGYAQQGYGYGQMGYGMGQQSMVQSNGYPGTQPMAYPGATQMPTTNINPMGGAVPRNLGASLQPNARPSFVQSIIRPGQLISSGQQPVPGNPVPYSGAVSTTGTMQGAAPHAAPGSTGGMNAPGSQSTAPGSGSSQPPKPSFRIPEGQEGRYANLYSLISTIESLEDEYCNGYITSEEHNKLFSELQSQFNTVQNALNLTTEDIRTFCNHCKLSGSYAFAALFNSTPEISTSLNHSNNVDLQQAVALGTDFTTLSDYCMVDAVTAGQYLQLIRQIKGRLQSMNILQQNEEAKNITDYWLDVFEKMKPNDKVPNDIIEKLKSQIGVWRTSVIDSMH